MSDTGGDGTLAGEDKKTSVMEDPNAKTHLEALFEVIQSNPNVGGSGAAVPKSTAKVWRERPLPPSFFDSSSASGSSPDKFPPLSKTKHRLGPSINLSPPQGPQSLHSRSMSMPATFDAPHMKQYSADSTFNPIPLPPGWEAAKTPDGLTYFIE